MVKRSGGQSAGPSISRPKDAEVLTGVSFEVAVISRAESSAGVEVGGEATFFDVAGVEQGGATVAVTHPLLDVVEVGTGFEMVGGE